MTVDSRQSTLVSWVPIAHPQRRSAHGHISNEASLPQKPDDWSLCVHPQVLVPPTLSIDPTFTQHRDGYTSSTRYSGSVPNRIFGIPASTIVSPLSPKDTHRHISTNTWKFTCMFIHTRDRRRRERSLLLSTTTTVLLPTITKMWRMLMCLP